MSCIHDPLVLTVRAVIVELLEQAVITIQATAQRWKATIRALTSMQRGCICVNTACKYAQKQSRHLAGAQPPPPILPEQQAGLIGKRNDIDIKFDMELLLADHICSSVTNYCLCMRYVATCHTVTVSCGLSASVGSNSFSMRRY